MSKKSHKHQSKKTSTIETPDLNRVLPKRGSEKFTVTSIRIREGLLARVQAIAKKQGYTHNEAFVRLVEWACNAFDIEDLHGDAPGETEPKDKDVK